MRLTHKGMLHYTACGLDYVYLANGFRREETAYGPGSAIDDIDGLHAAIAADIVHHRATLAGPEIRFLRKELDLTQSALAHFLGVDVQTVARWEKGQSEIPGPADRLVRLLYLDHKGGSQAAREVLEALSELGDDHHQSRSFEEADGAWRLREAA
jgi:putative transcriptional regulator